MDRKKAPTQRSLGEQPPEGWPPLRPEDRLSNCVD